MSEQTALDRTDRLQVTIREAAEMMSFAERTIRRMVNSRELRTVGRGRLRRIAVADLREWQERNRD